MEGEIFTVNIKKPLKVCLKEQEKKYLTIIEIPEEECAGLSKSFSSFMPSSESIHKTNTRKFSDQRKLSFSNRDEYFFKGYYPHSARSSLRGSSVHSFPVLKNRLTCFGGWSLREKILVSVVGILCIIIIGLIVALSVNFTAPTKPFQMYF